jgi:hypothetical protein
MPSPFDSPLMDPEVQVVTGLVLGICAPVVFLSLSSVRAYLSSGTPIRILAWWVSAFILWAPLFIMKNTWFGIPLPRWLLPVGVFVVGVLVLTTLVGVPLFAVGATVVRVLAARRP